MKGYRCNLCGSVLLVADPTVTPKLCPICPRVASPLRWWRDQEVHALPVVDAGVEVLFATVRLDVRLA